MSKCQNVIHSLPQCECVGEKDKTIATLQARVEELEAKIATLESEREWTSVEDGLPEEGVPVLVVSAHWPDSVYAALRIDEGDGWLWAQMGAYGGNLNDVSDYEADDDYQYSHWRPLPAHPEAMEG